MPPCGSYFRIVIIFKIDRDTLSSFIPYHKLNKNSIMAHWCKYIYGANTPVFGLGLGRDRNVCWYRKCLCKNCLVCDVILIREAKVKANIFFASSIWMDNPTFKTIDFLRIPMFESCIGPSCQFLSQNIALLSGKLNFSHRSDQWRNQMAFPRGPKPCYEECHGTHRKRWFSDQCAWWKKNW